VYKDVLKKLNLNDSWLEQQLMGINIKTAEEVFFASVNEKKNSIYH